MEFLVPEESLEHPCPCWRIPVAAALTYVAVVHPDALPVVAAPAFHDVVGIIRLCHLVVGVDHDLGGDGRIRNGVMERGIWQDTE